MVMANNTTMTIRVLTKYFDYWNILSLLLKILFRQSNLSRWHWYDESCIMIVRWFQGDSNGNLYAYIMSTVHHAAHGITCDKHQATHKNINTEGKGTMILSWHDKINPVTGLWFRGIQVVPWHMPRIWYQSSGNKAAECVLRSNDREAGRQARIKK